VSQRRSRSHVSQASTTLDIGEKQDQRSRQMRLKGSSNQSLGTSGNGPNRAFVNPRTVRSSCSCGKVCQQCSTVGVFKFGIFTTKGSEASILMGICGAEFDGPPMTWSSKDCRENTTPQRPSKLMICRLCSQKLRRRVIHIPNLGLMRYFFRRHTHALLLDHWTEYR
jgi:hypothetical protein